MGTTTPGTALPQSRARASGRHSLPSSDASTKNKALLTAASDPASVTDWFLVDKVGLSKVMERNGKSFIVLELLQNAWDQRSICVKASLHLFTGNAPSGSLTPGASWYELIVEDDDPDGFADLSHAYKLFAESGKKGDPTKRGRFNLGEKLIIAMCAEASVVSTTGTVIFDARGRHVTEEKRAQGSVFRGIVPLTPKEYREIEKEIHRLLPPATVETIFNDVALERRTPVQTVTVTLPTEIADEDGRLRRTQRKTQVVLYEPRSDEKASIYEMGIPVVETGDHWHLDVMQKVPLSLERINVTPAYLQALRTAVLNAMYEQITPQEASSRWVRDALADERVSIPAVRAVVENRFGPMAVISDVSDPEANKLALSQGYNIAYGNSFSREEWRNVQRADVLRPAGQVTPSPRSYEENPDIDRTTIPEDKWNAGMRYVVAYARYMATRLLGHDISVRIVNDSRSTTEASYEYGGRAMTLNVGRLGYAWFVERPDERVDSLLIHELGHDLSPDHHSEGYYRALCDLGARLVAQIRAGTFAFVPPPMTR